MSEQPPADPPSGFVPVCAIGASAGGVGALQTLFRLLPDDLGLAFVVVVHLSPDHPSAMDEILGACTRMPVHQVKDGPRLRANCVYVIAPDSELVITGDDVQSRPFTDPRGRRAPIDMFFRSIAAGRGDGIAVVLTGAGSDGAVGVRAVKEAGGIVMVQEPAEAGYPSMPQNAIATGVADVVAPLARLAERIAEAAHSKEAVRSLDESGVANDIRRIVAFLRMRTGHDFSGYKRSTVLRRIQRRMQVCQIGRPVDYLQHLRANPEEAKELLSDLLISVTMFFRDAETFVALNHRVIRPLLEARSAGDTEDELRAWVVGCATGEEAYSIAILLLEEAEQLKVHAPIQIFATDLDEGALATAREGRYPRSIEADVSAERLRRFFIDEGTHYRIDRQVRDLVLFATHSVVREPPFMRLDLITCRNVLIYLERAMQNHVSSIFRYGLKADGYLFLGTAETADNHFTPVDRDARIYRALPTRPDFVPSLASPASWSAGRPALTESRLANARLEAGEVLGESHAAALEASAPPSALVDREHGVLHLSPTVGRFILLSAGPLSGRLPSIVRPELRLDLKLALDRAFETRQPTITRPIDVVVEGQLRRVSLYAMPLPTGEGAAPRAIVSFLDSGAGRTEEAEEPALPPDELQYLHSELKVAQEAELAGRIRHESAVQELRASNEELQSLNEEYRSTAEELETSKEELQSINEELQTVNAELKSKLAVISAAHNDLQNLTASSEIGTLFLDGDLRIRMFTPRVAELINVADADVGRPLTNFTHSLHYDGFAGDVRRVLRDLAPFETNVRTVDGRWFLVRIRPYRTLDNKVEGAVVTFDDITARKKGEAALRDSEVRYRTMFQVMGEGYLLADVIFDDRNRPVDIEYLEANPAAVRMLGTDVTGRRLREVDPDYEDYWYEIFGNVALTGESTQDVRYAKPGDIYYDFSVTKVHPSDPESRRIAIRFVDATARVRAEQALRDSLERFRALATTGGNLIYHMSPDWRLMYQLDSDTLALTPEPIEDWVEKYIPAEDLRAVRAAITEAIRTKSLFELEHRVRRGDGSLGWVLSRAVPLLNGNGDIAEWFGAGNDVTDRVRAVEQLRESEVRFRTLADTAPALIWQNDAAGENTFVNRYFLDHTGLSVDEMSGERWRAMIHPDDIATYVADYMAAVREQRPFHNRNRIRRRDGAWRWFENYAQPLFDENDRYVGHVGVSTDIAVNVEAEKSLRASERWQQTLLEGVPQLVWRAIDHGRWTWASPQWTAYTGQAEADSHGYGWLEPVHPEDRERVKAVWADSINRGEYIAEYRIKHVAEERYRWFQTRATPVRDGEGAIVEWLGTSTDVDDLRQLQEHQHVLLAELQHRTRNLMGVIRSTFEANLRSSTNLDDFALRYRDRIGAIARVQSLLSRLHEGERITFGALIRDEMDAVGAGERATLTGPEHVLLRSSTVQIFALALHELATNALKYGALSQPSGHLAVTWRLQPAERDGRPWLHVDWSESGVNMPSIDAAPMGTGQGRRLIEQALPYQLGARTTYVMGPDGVQCSIAVPVSSRMVAADTDHDSGPP